MHSEVELEITGHVKITDTVSGVVLLDKENAIHTINMPRVLARGLANEPNYFIYKLSLGNGGTYNSGTDIAILKPPNDGTNGDGFQSSLYNETFSIIVDSTDPNFDPTGGTGVVSEEVGSKSNVIITAYLGQNKPAGETTTNPLSSPTPSQLDFNFNEMGLYCYGLPDIASHGLSSVFVGNKISTDLFPIIPAAVLTLVATVDNVQYTCTITVPASGTGTDSSITFGDFCQGFNDGSWITAGTLLNTYLYSYITDFTDGTYSTLLGAPNSEGYLIFESKSTGSTSNVTLSCTANSITDFFNTLTNGICGYVNINQVAGQNAGVQNDATELYNTCPEPVSQEQERLLSHLIFNPLLKNATNALLIVYTLTISVTTSQDTTIQQVLNVPPSSPTPSPSVTTSVTPTPSPTPSITPSAQPTPTPTATSAAIMFESFANLTNDPSNYVGSVLYSGAGHYRVNNSLNVIATASDTVYPTVAPLTPIYYFNGVYMTIGASVTKTSVDLNTWFSGSTHPNDDVTLMNNGSPSFDSINNSVITAFYGDTSNFQNNIWISTPPSSMSIGPMNWTNVTSPQPIYGADNELAVPVGLTCSGGTSVSIFSGISEFLTATGASFVYTSSDGGTTWTQTANPNTVNSQYLMFGVMRVGSSWISIGCNADTNDTPHNVVSSIWSSSDATSWSNTVMTSLNGIIINIQGSFPVSGPLYATDGISKIAIISPFEANNIVMNVAGSSDSGATWTAGNFPCNVINLLFWDTNNSQFVCQFQNASNHYQLATSSDGITWTIASPEIIT